MQRGPRPPSGAAGKAAIAAPRVDECRAFPGDYARRRGLAPRGPAVRFEAARQPGERRSPACGGSRRLRTLGPDHGTCSSVLPRLRPNYVGRAAAAPDDATCRARAFALRGCALRLRLRAFRPRVVFAPSALTSTLRPGIASPARYALRRRAAAAPLQ